MPKSDGEKIARKLIKNETEFTINVYYLAWEMKSRKLIKMGPPHYNKPGVPGIKVKPNAEHKFGSKAFTFANHLWVAEIAATGGIQSIATTSKDGKLVFGCDGLAAPHNVGPVPVPLKGAFIPNDSPRIVVGCGRLPNKNSVLREQYWTRAPDSYSLAPGETKEVSFNHRTGIQSTSSEQHTTTESVGAEASGGWGAFSASVSASLSNTSATSQSVTVSEEESTFISKTLENNETTPQTVFAWQLVDLITIFNSSGTPIGSVVQKIEPLVFDGPYDPRDY